MASRWTLWRTAIAVGVVGGILSGEIGALLRNVLSFLVAGFGLYSGPDLVIHSLTALCVGFGLKELVGKSWWLAGAVMGMATVLTMLLFPIGAHNLPPCHWSALTVLPAGLAGMALKEVMESGGEAKFESGKALKQ